jgi:hypothetical protein
MGVERCGAWMARPQNKWGREPVAESRQLRLIVRLPDQRFTEQNRRRDRETKRRAEFQPVHCLSITSSVEFTGDESWDQRSSRGRMFGRRENGLTGGTNQPPPSATRLFTVYPKTESRPCTRTRALPLSVSISGETKYLTEITCRPKASG